VTFASYINNDVNRYNDLEYVAGSFCESEYDKFFEFALRNKDELPEFAPIEKFPHLIFVTGGTRYAMVKKTVAYVIVDEDADLNPVVEKWNIKSYRKYQI
jgi:hypothetical protein